MRGERGFALVITLVVTALLVALSAEFAGEVYVDSMNRHGFVAGQQASVIADAGVTSAIRLLNLARAGKDFTSLLDRWAQPLEIGDDNGTLRLSIVEESGKLNLNYLVLPNGDTFEPYHGIAVRLLKKLALAPDLADSVADWVDSDDIPRPGGAETRWYGARTPPAAVKNAPLETLEELRLVKGCDGAALDRLRPLVTVYADSAGAPAAQININTASRELIASLDERMTDDLAQRIVDYRKTTPFERPADLAKVPGMETIAIGLQGNLVVKGNVYRIRSEAKVGETVRIIEAVVRLQAGQSTILYWREY